MADDIHLDADTCADIAAGLVSRAELEMALAHARRCPTCEPLLMAALGDRERPRRPPPGQGRIVPVASTAAPIRRLLSFTVPLALAAGLLVVFLLPAISPRPAPPAAFWIPATFELLEMRDGAPAEADSAFWSGLLAYQAHDEAGALRRFEASRPTGAFEDLRELYLASLLVNAGRPRDALDRLKKLEVEYLPEPWKGNARWIEYLALVALNRNADAQRRLTELAETPGPAGDRAREVLETR